MPTADPSPVTAPEAQPPSGARPRQVLALLVLSGLTLLLGALVPLAPVVADEPVVSWPRAGEQPTSTVLPLSPYRPLSLHATVPCRTLRALNDKPGDQYALITMNPDGDANNQGLAVAVDNGEVAIIASGANLVEQELPARDCEYQVAAHAAGVGVSLDGRQVAAREGLPVPQVAQLATDASGSPDAEGLAVRLRTDDRYASQPSALKLVLLLSHLAALGAALVLGWRLWRGSGSGLVRPRFGAADGVLVGVSLLWTIIGPVAYDDSWYLLMARNADAAGYLGNYVYMFNVTENPFVAAQYLLQAWGTLGQALFSGGWGLLWMRLLPLVYGLVTWALLRVLLATVLGRAARLRWVPWMLLLAHLVWWLPYGLTLRPESLVVPLAAGVLVLAELARRRHSVAALALATAVSALAVTAAPAGLAAAAPLVMALPWLLEWLRERGWLERVAAVALAGASATIAIPVGFADATLGDVISATQVHRWYYFTHHWYEEIIHYQTLLVNQDAGQWSKRLPVALTLAVLLVAAVASGRRIGVGDPVRQLLHGTAVTVAVALALLALTPTKWVNHFGAVAAPATVLLAAALLRTPLPRRSGVVVSGVTVAALVAAAGLAFAGPNLWRPFSDWGQPFGNHLNAGGSRYEVSLLAPHLGPVFLRNPVVWVAVAAALAGGIALWRRSGRRTSLTADRALLVTISGLAVVLMLGLFVYAPLRHYPGWTVPESNLQALTGETCGLDNAVRVLGPARQQPGEPIGEVVRTGDFALADGVNPPLQPPGPGAVWHDAAGDRRTFVATERGSLISPWYPLPPGSGATHVTVPVAGGELDGQRLALEFATGAASAPLRPAARVEPEIDTEVATGTEVEPDTWQEVAVPLSELADDEKPTAVRVVAQDAVSGEDSWLAVAEPSLTSWQPVSTVTFARPVFADQLSAALWPCVDQVAIAHGIVEAPTVRLVTDDGVAPWVLANPNLVPWGGTFAQADRTATYVRMTSQLGREVPGTRNWGHVQRVAYNYPVGLVDLTVEQRQRAGWTRFAPLTGEGYAGRPYLG